MLAPPEPERRQVGQRGVGPQAVDEPGESVEAEHVAEPGQAPVEGQVGVLRDQVHQRGGEQQAGAGDRVLGQARQQQRGQQQRAADHQAALGARGEPGERRPRLEEDPRRQRLRADAEGDHRQYRQRAGPARHAAHEQSDREQPACGERGVEGDEALGAEGQRRRDAEQAAQVAAGEDEVGGAELAEQPQPDQHQSGLAAAPADHAARAPALQPPLRPEQRTAPARAGECAEQAAGRVAAEVEIARHPAGQVVLQRLQAEAEQPGEQRGDERLAREAPLRRQRRRQQQPERQVAEDVEEEIFEDEVLRPWRPQPVERRQAAVAPAGQRMQAGISDQQRIGERERGSEGGGRPCGHAPHCASWAGSQHPGTGCPCARALVPRYRVLRRGDASRDSGGGTATSVLACCTPAIAACAAPTRMRHASEASSP
ncbi:MAG: hypothetical protein BWZ09_02242 [Alphaproteobacteria bacterium ADurb.BinA305]|nr:MAG: hypothetical protein BWZ09_02242 [Alphaproteobacteria bacterium ADurb.BinA305]